MMNKKYKLVRAIKKAFGNVTQIAVEGCFVKLQDVLRKGQGTGGNNYKLGCTKPGRDDLDDDSDDNFTNNKRINKNRGDKRNKKPQALHEPKYNIKKQGETVASV